MRKFFSICLVAVMMLTVSSLISCSEQQAPAPEARRLTKKTASGAEFKRASEEDLKAAGIKDPKKFGEAWEDPSGMIWSDIAKKEDGSPLCMNHIDAEAYCKSLGAELPSGWQEDENGKHGYPDKDSDFVRLRKYMGAEYAAGHDTPQGYAAQILPNLTRINEEGEVLNRWYWSSSETDGTDFAYIFTDRDGDVGYGIRFFSYGTSVRCVVHAARVDR